MTFFFFFRRIPFRTLPFPWSPWRAGSPRRRSLPNGRRSRNLWWDWKKLRRKANPDTHTGHRPGQGSLIDARHYWVPVMIISFVVLTHGATLTTPPSKPPIVCDRMQELGVTEKVVIFQIGDFGTLWQTILDFQELRIFLCYIVLYHIFEQISFNSYAVEEYNILKGACSYILCFVLIFFCSFFVYMEKVEDIVCKREINYFGGLPFQ